MNSFNDVLIDELEIPLDVLKCCYFMNGISVGHIKNKNTQKSPILSPRNSYKN